MFLPLRGWAQSFSNTGAFYFTGSHNPIRTGNFRFRQFLPGDGLKVGPARVHPFLGVAQVYTDNVFRTDTQRKGGTLTTIAPGIQASLPFGGRHSMLFDYRAAQFLYAKFSQNNALAQNGLGHLQLDFPSGLKLDFQANHVEGFDPRGSQVDSRQNDITKWNVNSFRNQVEFTGANLGIRVAVNHLRLHFKNNDQAAPRDRNTTSANLTVFIPATVGASGLLGVLVADRNYDENNQLDSFSYGVFTGFRLAPSRQVSGEFNLGYSILNFDRAPLSQPPGSGLSVGGKQQKALFMRGDLRWRPTTRLDVRLRPFRAITQSAVFNTTTFIRTGAKLSVRQQLRKRFEIQGSFLYSNNNFQDSRTDNRFRWRTVLRYRTVEWLGFQLSYTFSKRSSSDNQFDFYSNTVMISVQGLL